MMKRRRGLRGRVGFLKGVGFLGERGDRKGRVARGGFGREDLLFNVPALGAKHKFLFSGPGSGPRAAGGKIGDTP